MTLYASAVIYSLVETARENNLHIYHYFEYLLKELPKLKEFISPEDESQAMERLLPWSESLPNVSFVPLGAGVFYIVLYQYMIECV